MSLIDTDRVDTIHLADGTRLAVVPGTLGVGLAWSAPWWAASVVLPGAEGPVLMSGPMANVLALCDYGEEE